MRTIQSYELTEKIDAGSESVLYRGKKPGDARTVILQMISKAKASTSEIVRFKHEYNKISEIDSDYVIRINELFDHDGDVVLVTEDFAGSTLNRLIVSGGIDIERFLDLAIQICRAIGEIHRNRIIHQALTPHNILTDDDCHRIKITGFGATRLITHIQEEIYDPLVIREILPYMSPEQTGRMNCSVDQRTDLYSLGIVFYELLTGTPPFISSDPTEIIHAHIARMPPPPNRHRYDIPKIVSDIVMKLISKPFEKRYCNSFGVMHDLEHCRRELSEKGRIDPFPLGRKDISTEFHIPENLFGRKAETDALIASFKRICRGDSELLLVAGPPGIGKSALIREIQKPVTTRKGYFISGKYDQYMRDIPYSAITAAFSEWVRQILFESEERIGLWRHEIQKALGINGRVIADLIPGIELIIGSPPPVPALGPEETQNRFHHVFKNFINVCGRQAHPLVLFLDDLQWADAASLRLIQMLAADPGVRFLLIVGAFRDNEISPSHPLPATLAEIEKKDGCVTTLTLPPIDVVSVNQLMAVLLRCDVPQASVPAKMVHEKTGGNPFFIHQLLKILHDRHVFKLDPQEGWTWDIEEMANIRVTDNVVDLMAERMKQLPSETRQILMTCACIGTRFDPMIASAVSGKSVDQTMADLGPALDSGLIDFIKDSGEFRHDRIRDAVYSLLSRTARIETHHAIGRYLLDAAGEARLNDNVIDIVNHLNIARDLISDEQEKYRLARLNCLAGQKALSSAAYQSAFHYFTAGIESCGECWEDKYDLVLALFTGAAETAYLNTYYDETRRLTDAVLAHARSQNDRMKAHIIRLHMLMAQNKLSAVIDSGLSALKSLGVRFPKKPTKAHILLALLKTKLSLAGRKPESLKDLPRMEDPDMLARVDILATIISTAYWTAPNLVLLIAFELVRMFVKKGNTGFSPYIYGCYGFVLCSIGDIDSGYRYGEMAIELLEQMDEKKQKARTGMVFNVFIRHFKSHAKNEITPLLNAYQNGLDEGDVEFAAHTMMARAYTLYLVGTPIAELEPELRKSKARVEDLGQITDLHLVQMDHQAVLTLQGKCDGVGQLKGESYDDEKMLPIHLAASDNICLVHLYYNKLILNYLFRNYPEAHRMAMEADKYSDSRGSLCYPVTIFYDSLTCLAAIGQVPELSRRKALRRAAANQRKMKKWAHHAPENFLHKYHLVAAEIARVKGENQTAMENYEKAIQGADKNGYIQEMALACECAARFYQANGYADIAAPFMIRAYQAYIRWGAEAKVMDLEQNDWALLQIPSEGKAPQAMADRDTLSVSDTGAARKMDIAAILKMSQAISGEIILERLLVKMMKLIIELSGAEKGALILNRADRLVIEAEGVVTEDAVAVSRQDQPVEESNALSAGIVSYVRRTGETLVLHDALGEGLFVADPYIQKNQVRSLLCLPLIRQQRIIGIIYLENNLTPNAFRAERRDIVQLLSTQAAISLENAVLVDDIEKQREQYRLLVETMNDGLGVIDADRRFQYVNDSLCRMSGYSEEELIGKPFQDFLEAGSRERVETEFFGKSAADHGIYELMWRRKDGSPIFSIVSPKPIFDAEGRFSGAFAIVTDITELKKAQKEKEIMQAQLLQAQKMETVGKLAGGVAHDFNNYLTAITGSIDLLMLKTDKDDQRIKYLKEIKKAAERSATLTHQLLAFSRKQMLKTSAVSLNEVVAHMEKLLRRIIGENITFKLILDPQLKMVNADWGQMEQVIMNLSVNARDAMPGGGVMIIKTENVAVDEAYCRQIADARPGDFVCLTIEDTGKGIEPELLENIFEPFFTTKGTGQGTGLGLSVAFGVIKQHEGWINVYSEPGNGTQFKVYLPKAVKRAAFDPESSAPSERAPAGYAGKGERLLVIEDQKEVRQFIAEALTMSGYHVIDVGSIAEARRCIENRAKTFDLLFTDVVLPDGSGIDFAERVIRQMPDIRVLISSGYTEIESHSDVTNHGRFHFLQKPYPLEKLLEMIHRTLTGE